MVKRLEINEFKYGTIDSVEDSAIPRGAASRSLNWLTKGVSVELRRGMALLGATENTGLGHISGLAVAQKPSGEEIVYRTRKRKVEYLDVATGDWVEVGTDTLPAAVIAADVLGEDISIQPYQNLTGYQVWLNSPNAGPHKINTANPGDILNLTSARNYKGKMRVKSNRQFLWGRLKDYLNIYGSKLDSKNDSDYTLVTDEVASTSGTLAFKGEDATGKDFTVSSTTETIDSYGEANADQGSALRSGASIFFGQSFHNSVLAKIATAKFFLKKNNSPTGNATAKIYAHTGTFGAGGVPTGAALATSDNFDVSTLTTTSQLITFTFSGANLIDLSANTDYCIELSYSGGDASNYIVASWDGSGSTAPGSMNSSLDGSTWIPNATYDAVFYVYGTTYSTFDSTTHGFAHGDVVRASTTATLPTGLTAATTYYLYWVSANSFYLYADADFVTQVKPTSAGSGTHTIKKYGALRTCFSLSFTDGTESFTDNGDGTLTGSAGGTGTINYTTGVYALTFNGTPGAIKATYNWCDDTDGGIADFRFSDTRLAGEGFVRLQGSSGNFQNIASYNLDEYCFHENKTWSLIIATDDSTVSSVIYRDRVGIPNHRAMVETGDGIYYIDDTDKNEPHFRLMSLAYQSISGEVVPNSISKQRKLAELKVGVNLADYVFDRGVAIEFGDLVLFACRTMSSEKNNRVFIYNKVSKAFDVADYSVSCFAIYNGTLIAGDDISDNVYTLLSGTDDDESDIGNYWEGSLDNLGASQLKRAVQVVLDGNIGPEQAINISLSVDNGPFTEIRAQEDVTLDQRAIEGGGYYVDKSQKVNVGALTLGRGEIGGGGPGLEAYHYRRQFRIALDKFEFVKIRFEATKLGYASISEFTFHDVRIKWGKVPNKYRENR